MHKKIIHLAVALFSVAVSTPTIANDSHRVGIGFGLWGVMDDADKGAIHLHYEFAEQAVLWNIRPVILSFFDDNSHYFISIGGLREFYINDKLSWGVGLQAGYFNNSIRLDNDMEFYSRIYGNYHLDESFFIRAELGHISNAGLGDTNPGSENVTITANWSF